MHEFGDDFADEYLAKSCAIVMNHIMSAIRAKKKEITIKCMDIDPYYSLTSIKEVLQKLQESMDVKGFFEGKSLRLVWH